MNTTLPSVPLNILVVEDNPGDFILLRESIHLSGIAVADIQMADTLAAATGLLKHRKPDIVFLDLYLPDSSGLESFHLLQEYMTNSAVIILSGLSDTKVARQAIAGGAQDFLAKGEFDEKLLAKTILYSLERKRSVETLREANEKYRQIFYDNPFPMFLNDIETLQILECNNAALNKYGYTREELLNLTTLGLQTREGIEQVRSCAADPRGFDEIGNRIWRHTRKNGEEMMVEIFINTIEYGGKKVRQLQINDVTEKLKLSTELEESRLRQERAVNIATIEGQENERKQLGIELHDNINQILATAKLYLDFSMSTPSVDKDMLLKSKEYIMLATEEIRKLSHALLPHCLEEFGLLMALDELVQPFSVTGKVQIVKQWDGFDEEGMKKDQKLTIYRIVQEQLNNILKHAAAKRIVIALRVMDDSKNLELLIRDDGQGFEPALKRNGVGIRNIISRAALFEGKVNIDSQPGQGCELKVVFTAKKQPALTERHFYNN
jgi:two-component system, NarL family, sensor histidine kinase UhpB